MNRWKRHLDVYEHIKQGLSTTDIIWHCRMMTATTTARREFEEHIDETDDAIWSALNSTTKWDVSSSRSINIKKEYESRLLSFRASTYYAKPACLSPLICARFGWLNADQDMLSCTSCHAALSITFPSGLSAEAMETICAAYRQQLSTAHKPNCSFRLLADQYLRRVEEPPVTIPLAFASVFPTELVQIMEHPFPSQLLSNQIRKIQDVCPSLWEFPELEIAYEIQSFQPQEDHQKTAVEVITNLVDRFGTNSISVGWLAILGWTPIHAKAELDLESQNPMVSLGCPMCMSIMELSLCKSTSSRNNQEETSRPSKRQKRLARFCNPYDAHRHYCPFKCGFPTRMLLGGTPLWQVLISRFISEQDDKETDNVDDDDDDTSREKVLDPEKAVARIREILFSGLVPKKVNLDMDEEHNEEG